MSNYQLQVKFSEEEINNRVKELGREISSIYNGIPQDLVAVCILKSAVIFYADLIRALDCPVELDFMRVRSYGKNQESSKAVECLIENSIDVTGRDVLIVEDIVDSGHTMAYLLEYFKKKKPNSLKVAALLNKPSRREIDIDIDFIGFEVENHFLVGYGFDFDEQHRTLPAIYELKY